ncbi:MAG: T9SS type A sorting domain-containing protein [Bacteroidales bacterium]|jgi:hypothetical protein|nr:T9SS type A sorting domain-containing protein [Bacteroidales bacterium]
MKKVLLPLFIVIFAFAAVAQNTSVQKIDPASVVAISKQAATTGRETGQPEVMTSSVVRATSADPVGHSYYDLQTNASLSKRIIAHEDGTVSMVWNASNTQATSRGTGYNYFDGTSLINNSMPIGRIENTRTGWGTIGTLGTGSNIGEVVVSHNGTTGLAILTRETKGTGTWKSSELQGPSISNGITTSTCLLWPSIATVADTVHLIACTDQNADNPFLYEGINVCLLYYRGVYDRSTQNVTWTSPVIVGDMTSAKQTHFSGDSYSISANGNNVAVLYGENPTDIFYWLSNNGGRNWEKHIIFDTPVPDAFDARVHLVLDTPFVADGSNSIIIDDNGIVHVAFSITRLLNDSLATPTYKWYPLYDGLIYWNSTMEPLTDESDPAHSLDPTSLEARGIQVFRRLDLTGEGSVSLLNGNDVHITSYYKTVVSMPQLAWDNNNVYITYCAEVEYPFVQWDMSKMYRGVFAAKSTDNGATWNNNEISWISYGPNFMYMDWRAYDGLDDPNDAEQVVFAIKNYSECTFPAISNVADGKINILWQSAYLPGSYIRENGDLPIPPTVCTTTVDMNWLQIAADSIGIFNNYKEIPTGVWGLGVQTHNSIKDVNIFPNPASNHVKVVIETTENAPASLTVTNLLGQTVHAQQISISAGTNVLDLNVSGYPSGFYMINIKTSTGNSTKKLIVQ